MVLICTTGLASAAGEQRTYEAGFFRQFTPQTALEMLLRVPGFVLQEADENRGLSQGGTNVLLNGQPIIGKGETATTQIGQIAAASVVRIEVIDAGTLDLPGFTGLVANIVSDQKTLAGAFLWEPQWRRDNEPELLNAELSVSGSRGQLDFSAAFAAEMVRSVFLGPETVSDAAGQVFEIRDEQRFIEGNQQTASGSVQWQLPRDRSFNAKASVVRLDIDRPQISRSRALAERGFNGLNQASSSAGDTNIRLDTDYNVAAFGGALKLIGFAARESSDGRTRVVIEQDSVGVISDRRFNERSDQDEGVLRLEQSWEGATGHSWQLAIEGAHNQLKLSTALASASDTPLSFSRTNTKVQERRAELTLAHRRALSSRLDLQLSLGAETSTIEQGAVKRSFDRPKGFISINANPTAQWTLTARAAREVGQINFRDFSARVSLVEEVETQNNAELVPQQSWLFTARAERRFDAGHVASLELGHERIDDLVDRIPIGDTGDAVGNIADASRNEVTGVLTLIGAAAGIPGAQLDLRGSWQWSSVIDPIDGRDREIGRLRTRDLRAEFRHDIADSDWTYGFVFQDIELAPLYQSTLVQFQDIPSGGLTPGRNALFLEHRNLFGLRVRATLSEFNGQKSRFSRAIFAGRRDVAQLDRVEARARDLGGPFLGLSIGKTF